MNKKTYTLLEFDLIKKEVASFAKSDEAASLIVQEEPFNDEEKIHELKQSVLHIIKRIASEDDEPYHRLPSLENILSKLELDRSTLEQEEAFALGLFIKEGRLIIKWLYGSEAGTNNALSADGENADVILADCSKAADQIFSVLDSDGNLRDLDVFRRIKERISALQKELHSISLSYSKDEETRGMLQSELPSLRNGRIVIALKANFRGKIRGIVHKVSATGQTLFLEPEEIIEKNNNLLIEERRLTAEVRRVLTEMTASVSRYKNSIRSFYRRILYIETVRARAHHARRTNGLFARSVSRTDARAVMLRAARHPLLGADAVPVDVIVKEGARAVIITGPNAGGKTAVLKTVGLFALMNQSGFALPAQAAELPLFDRIFAGIGDEQSLQGALSTFSAQIKNIAAILNETTDRSLVLLDELGSGTGAEEGGALAMALLDAFTAKGALLFVTTHSNALKNYGWTHPFVENASMEFDERTGAPSYRVLMGVPGESKALHIARQNGLPEEILRRAQEYLSGGDSDAAALIAGLREKAAQFEREKELFDKERLVFLEERRKVEEREAAVRARALELKTGGIRELRDFLFESRKKLENLVRELKESGGVTVSREETTRVKAFLSELNAAVQSEQTDLAVHAAQERAVKRQAEPFVPIRARDIHAGMAVLAGERRARGIVKRAGRRGFWSVETGSVSSFFHESELFPDTEAETTLKPVIAPVDFAAPYRAKHEIDLRGLRLDEAMEALTRQLDAAAGNLGAFSVIHGTGEGILQRGVHQLLKESSAVAGYAFSHPDSGGAGRTEVTLKP
ncbi:MAG: Smr/MutS family protein [Spirochaetaceae bacterium]|jgi:DNA mismatch repair protein MutS2|nr:Smr/MutS family protein [Spirochaetaceae bacterium]